MNLELKYFKLITLKFKNPNSKCNIGDSYFVYLRT